MLHLIKVFDESSIIMRILFILCYDSELVLLFYVAIHSHNERAVGKKDSEIPEVGEKIMPIIIQQRPDGLKQNL
jgi:hypothetical protein